MIDLHCHILPKIDDGSKNIEESMELILSAEKLGYKKICCTSHYRAGKYENKNYDRTLKKLRDQLKLEKVDIELLEGNELFLDLDGLTALKEKKVKTLNRTSYLLVEAIPGMTEMALKKSLGKIRGLGYKPVLAHVERYPFIEVKTLHELKKIGVIIQVNLKSLRHKKEIYRWIKLGLIDILASDVHDKKYRNYELADIISEIDNKLGRETRERLLTGNPEKIINNEDIEGTIDEKKIYDTGIDDDNFIKCFFKRFKFRRST
ncbi:tyrosine-protein phosphatase [Psychrilyobacter atlanticus]|uniref:tyrosine-protein phosphatase n=1 Tax=Psychrilyobacter atlanticus TaxID=271091 RepID=UPI00041A1D5F|nr:CpsB/CapC family capsule biosynthesis tyrosine phosphatase [Psychrilyobacter atlanticus]